MQQRPLSDSKTKRLNKFLTRAQQAMAAGQLDLFESACRSADKLQPGHAEVASMRGVVYAQIGRLHEAHRAFETASLSEPDQPRHFANLAKLQLAMEDYYNARSNYGKALALEPDSLPLQLAYAHCLIHFHQYEEAAAILEPAAERHPDNNTIRIALFCAYDNMNGYEARARQLIEQVLDAEPDNAEARMKLAQLDREEGHLDRAREQLQQLLSRPDQQISALQLLSPLKRYSDAEDPEIQLMQRLYDQSATNSDQRMKVSFMLGKARDDLKQYDEAFEYYNEGNRLRRKNCDYNEQLALAYLKRTAELFTPELMKQTSEIEDGAPIFIVGMPRCGSTLTEQILAAHPEVISRGECGYLEEQSLAAFHSLDNPITLDRMAAFTPAEWRKLGETYLGLLRNGDNTVRHITDKSLQNIWLIGAIRCALPNARIIHVRRNPLNSCISMFKLNFTGAQLAYTYDLEELANYYKMYQQVMQHWRDVLPEGAMYELKYEDLITNQENETRKLLDYCGLPWDERCLQFNKVENKVKTASIAQVRKPIYTDSLETWKRYEQHIAPLIQALGTDW